MATNITNVFLFANVFTRSKKINLWPGLKFLINERVALKLYLIWEIEHHVTVDYGKIAFAGMLEFSTKS